MSDLENVVGFQHGNETNVSEMAISSVSMAQPSEVANPFLPSSAWDPLVSLSQVQTFGGFPMFSHSEFGNSCYPLVLENQGVSSTSHLVQHMSDSILEDLVPKAPSYGIWSFSEMVGSFGQPGSSGNIANTGYQLNYKLSKEAGRERGPINNEQSQGEGSTPEEVDPASAPSENRRKRGLDSNSTLSPSNNAEGDAIKDSSGKSTDGVKEHDEKKPRVDQNIGAHLRGKQSVKQNKDDPHSGDAPIENFIHVRARRGQATNSHSLAERVRREKISERMKLLQELVPGCNKITGKAVMLDEIINYVQSLQQQVEFLSMKLATVNPELNFDVVERILSKDILQPRIGHRPIGGYGPSISCCHPLPAATGNFEGTLAGMLSKTQFPPLPRTVLHEIQSFYEMSYDSSTNLDNLAPDGRFKTE